MESFSDFITRDNIFALVGGLGLFLFGIKLMGDSLKALAGNQLRDLIKIFTTNRFLAVAAGTLSTVAIQSSSGTTALTISLVRAGLMELRQAIGVIMGANIGTTITAFFYAIKVKEFALPIIFIGSLIYMFSQSKKKSLIGQVIFGFGLLFFGMTVMEGPLKELSQTQQFADVMQSVAHIPALGILIGAGLTMLVQSSSATIVILQGLYATGAIDFSAAFAILLGDNIGTTITSLLASIGGSRDSQRAALSHIVFNLFGTVLFFTVMYGFGFISAYETFITNITANAELQIALSHLFFNVTVTFILVWFIDYIEKFVRFVIPRAKNEVTVNVNMNILDESLIHATPGIAVTQADDTIINLSDILVSQTKHALCYLDTDDKTEFAHVDQYEVAINALDKRLKPFLRDVSSEELNPDDAKKINFYMYVVNDLERIGDKMTDIVYKYKEFLENNEKLSEKARNEIDKMLKVSYSAVKSVNTLLKTGDVVVAGEIFEKEKHLDRMERKYYKEHLKRVKEGTCKGRLSISYIDLLSDIEKIGDHCQNIAEYLINADEILTEEEKEIDISNLIENL